MTARITIPSDRIATFWRRLDDGANAVPEREPDSGVRRIGALFSDREVQSVSLGRGIVVYSATRFLTKTRYTGLVGREATTCRRTSFPFLIGRLTN